MKEPKLYRFVRPLITVLLKTIYRPNILGKENIPSTGRIILAGNHTNNLDCLLLISTTKRTIHFLAKDELCQGLKKHIFLNMGIIPVNRRAKDPKSLQISEEYLKEEKVIGIFPEGTYPKKGERLLPFKMGAIKMAKDTNTMIVPFAITGKYRPFKKGLTIVFEKPIQIKTKDLEKEKDKLEEKISKMIGGNY